MVPVRYSDVAKQWWDRIGKPALLHGAVAGGEDVAIAAWMEAVAKVLKKVGVEMTDRLTDDPHPNPLLAVVLDRQLHSKRVFHGDGYGWEVCAECRQAWPCATEKAIRNALMQEEHRD